MRMRFVGPNGSTGSQLVHTTEEPKEMGVETVPAQRQPPDYRALSPIFMRAKPDPILQD